MVTNKTQQFAQEVKVTTDDTWYLKPDQTYVNAHTKIVLVHRHCNTEKAVTPRDFRNRGIYCRTCKTHTELKHNPYKVSRHVTPQQFAKRFYSILGHDYELLSDYVNTKTKLKVCHKPCGTVYTVYPTNVTQNHSGCPHCSAVQARYKQLANEVPFSQRVQQVVGDTYTFLQPYTNATTKMAVYHQDCGHIYYTTPNKFLNSNNRCPYCAKNRQLTTDRFKQHLYDLVGNGYTLLTPYVNAKTKVKVRHNKCGHTYWVVPSSFTSGGRRCPYCYGNIKKTTKDFKHELTNVLGNEYTLLGTYKNALTPILVNHNKCGHEFMATPHELLRGRRCPVCYKTSKYNNDIFEKKLYLLVGNEYTVLGKYVDSKTPIRIKHNKCGHIYKVRPNDFLNSNERCPYCNQSHGEQLVTRALKNLYGLTINTDFYYGYVLPNKLHLDFYLPKHKLAIEYDGIQHYQPVDFAGKGATWAQKHFKQQQLNDRTKDQYCKEHHIKLVRVPYTIKSYHELKKVLDQYL